MTEVPRCVAAIPLYVAAGQINAVMPSDAPLGRVPLRASFNGEEGNPSPATVVEPSLGIFSVNSGGFGPGIVQNFITPADQPINSKQASAQRGQPVVLWRTGLGPALGAMTWRRRLETFRRRSRSLSAQSVLACSDIAVGARAVLGSTRPSSISPMTGCYVPVQVRGGAVVSNTVTIAIEDGGACQGCFCHQLLATQS